MICLGTRVVVLCLLSVHQIAELSSFFDLEGGSTFDPSVYFSCVYPPAICLSVCLSIYQYKPVCMYVTYMYTHTDVDILAYENIKLKATRISMKNKSCRLFVNTSY